MKFVSFVLKWEVYILIMYYRWLPLTAVFRLLVGMNCFKRKNDKISLPVGTPSTMHWIGDPTNWDVVTKIEDMTWEEMFIVNSWKKQVIVFTVGGLLCEIEVLLIPINFDSTSLCIQIPKTHTFSHQVGTFI